jgi:hypothetical protein
MSEEPAGSLPWGLSPGGLGLWATIALRVTLLPLRNPRGSRERARSGQRESGADRNADLDELPGGEALLRSPEASDDFRIAQVIHRSASRERSRPDRLREPDSGHRLPEPPTNLLIREGGEVRRIGYPGPARQDLQSSERFRESIVHRTAPTAVRLASASNSSSRRMTSPMASPAL